MPRPVLRWHVIWSMYFDDLRGSQLMTCARSSMHGRRLPAAATICTPRMPPAYRLATTLLANSDCFILFCASVYRCTAVLEPSKLAGYSAVSIVYQNWLCWPAWPWIERTSLCPERRFTLPRCPASTTSNYRIHRQHARTGRRQWYSTGADGIGSPATVRKWQA